jgi:hypothetical protein
MGSRPIITREVIADTPSIVRVIGHELGEYFIPNPKVETYTYVIKFPRRIRVNSRAVIRALAKLPSPRGATLLAGYDFTVEAAETCRAEDCDVLAAREFGWTDARISELHDDLKMNWPRRGYPRREEKMAQRELETIEAIGIEGDSLWVKPTVAKFPFIYREAMEIEWDSERERLYSPTPREWSHARWFTQIRNAVREQGFELVISSSTSWHGIDGELRKAIIKTCSQ